jgi:hypothetical protein
VRGFKHPRALLLRGNVLVEKLGASIEIANQCRDPGHVPACDGIRTLRVVLMSHCGTPNAPIWAGSGPFVSAPAKAAPRRQCGGSPGGDRDREDGEQPVEKRWRARFHAYPSLRPSV